MSLLEKILGRHYKWWFLFKYNVAVANAGVGANIFAISGVVLNTIAVLYVWNTAGTTAAVFTYLLMGRIYKAIGENYYYNSLSDMVITGKISSSFMLPQPFILREYIQMLGRRLVRNSVEVTGFTLAAVICSFWFAKIETPSISTVFLIFFVPLTFTLNHLFGTLVGFVAFFIKDKREFAGLIITYENIKVLLIGMLIPLDKLPFTGFFQSLPYSWILHHPMQIYLGKYDNLEILKIWLFGAGWCLILLFISQSMLKLGLKNNESVGL